MSLWVIVGINWILSDFNIDSKIFFFVFTLKEKCSGKDEMLIKKIKIHLMWICVFCVKEEKKEIFIN